MKSMARLTKNRRIYTLQINDEKTDGEWWASKNIIMKSEDNAQGLDLSALLYGPYEVKLWNELERYDIFKLADDEKRL